MQPRGNRQGFPFILGGLIGAERGRRTCRCGLGEHQGQLWHPLTMPTGIRALGVDGAGEQLNERIKQLLLSGLQTLTLDTHCGGAGHRLQEGDAVGPQFFHVGRRAAVVDQQDQQANGFVVAVVQADADQVNAGRGHRQQDSLQVTRLIDTEVAHHIVGADQLLEPRRTAACLQVVAVNIERLQQLRCAIDDQSVWLHTTAVVITQINQPGLSLGDLHRFKQHPLQQRGKAGFGAQGIGDAKEARQGVFHSCHRHTQLVYFQHR